MSDTVVQPLTGACKIPRNPALISGWKALRISAPQRSWQDWQIALDDEGNLQWTYLPVPARVLQIGGHFEVKKGSTHTWRVWERVPSLSYALALAELA